MPRLLFVTAGLLILPGLALGTTALLRGHPGLAPMVGYPALGTASLLAARFL